MNENHILQDNINEEDFSHGWTEINLSEKMKRPCFAFKRGNIIFTTLPPLRKVDLGPKRYRSASVSNSSCSISVSSTENQASFKSERSSSVQTTRTDFCEVCCGIRSPSFSRKTHNFTTHFCTRVPAKRNTSTSSSSISDKQSNADSPNASSSSLINQRKLLSKNQGHISRLSTFLETRCSIDKNPNLLKTENSKAKHPETTASDTTAQIYVNDKLRPLENNTCDKCAHVMIKSDRSLNMNINNYNSYSSSYPSSNSSYLPLFLDQNFSSKSSMFSSTCCNCSTEDCSSSFEKFQKTSNSRQSCSYVFPRTTNMNRRIRNMFSSTESSSESDDETCSSEMGWSFSSFADLEKSKPHVVKSCSSNEGNQLHKSMSTGRAITPFESNTIRTMDVMEKFGTIVGAFRKPGHHIGPIRNADCLCDNCRNFFAEK